MKLQPYLDRIGYHGRVEPNIATLTALQEAHVCSVPFENLDLLLRRPVTTRVEDAYHKIVNNLRGGWCYEQNGLFGWALSEIGFDVARTAANVMRDERGEAGEAGHLCLLVRLPDSGTRYLVDVGFGGSLIRPIALREARYEQEPFQLGLERLDDGYWRFWESLGKGKFSFDFAEEPACESSLARKSAVLQTDPASHFVINLVAQKRSRRAHRMLRGRVFRVARAGFSKSRIVDSPEALVSLLANEFRLKVPGIAELWPQITARHEELFATGSVQ